jgi:cation:H+ antiporter
VDARTLILFLVGFPLLIGGAEFLVRGASKIFGALGISPLVIGLTVVAFGTSAPELAVSVRGSLEPGNAGADIAIGNIVGSNVINVLLILGLAAVITPLRVRHQLIRFDVPLMIAASFAVWALGADGLLSRWDGVILFGALLAYLVFTFFAARRDKKAAAALGIEEEDVEPLSGKMIAINGLFLVGGIAGLALGAQWLVDGAVQLATWMGVSELVIGLTVVAIGTSLPEVATSVVASIRGERDIAVGNVVGSNLFNLLCVLGLTALLPPAGMAVNASAIRIDLPIMCAVAVVCLPIFFTEGRIRRWEGWVLLAFFAIYIAFTLRGTMNEPTQTAFYWTAGFIVGLVGLTLFGLMAAAVRHRVRVLKRIKRREAATA